MSGQPNRSTRSPDPSAGPGARRHVVVVGGGISGLAAAYYLGQLPDAPRVTVLERDRRLGGKLLVAGVADVPVDQGAEAVLVSRPEAVDLAVAVGLGGDVVHPGVTGAGVWSRGAIRPLPIGTVLGVPADLAGLAATRIVSRRGLARAWLDHVLPRTRHVGERDVPIGWLVRRRLGDEIADRLVDPLLGGVYAGRADHLSLAATAPALAGPVRAERSLLAAARRARGAAPPRDPPSGPVFASLRGGLGRLPAEVAGASGAAVRTEHTVRELHRTAEGWRLVVGPTAAPTEVLADAVVLACPARPAGRLLEAVAPEAARALAGIEHASVAIVTLVLDGPTWAGRVPGTGFLVPAVEHRLVKGVTVLSQKWGWVTDLAQDRVVVRASVGRHGDVADIQRDPDDLAQAVAAEVAALVGLPPTAARASAWRVQKWGGGLPQYAVGHVDRVAAVRRAVGEHPGLAVCGAAYDGVGVPACIASARAAVEVVGEHLARVAQSRSGHNGLDGRGAERA